MKTDFLVQKQTLHEEMLKSIVRLFNIAQIFDVTLNCNDDEDVSAYVIVSTNGVESTYEAQVEKVIFEQGGVCVKLYGEDCYHNLGINGDIVWCSINEVYDAVYEVLSKVNRDFYYLPTAWGQPIGTIETRNITVGEFLQLKEEHGYIYEDYTTANYRANA